MREALDRLERIAAISEDDNKDDNGINNSNNGKNGDVNIGGRRREDISTSQGNHPQNLLSLSVEAEVVRCTLGDILYVLENIWVRHVPSSPIVLGSYIVSFRGGGGWGGNKGGGKNRDDNDGHDD